MKSSKTTKKHIVFIAQYLFKILVFFSLLIGLLVSYDIGVVPLGRISDKITQKNISSIKLGMNKCDVIDILGAPLNSDKSYIVSANGQVEPESIVITYMYSRPGILWDIEIYVNFDRYDKVIRVNMQEGDNDFYIYDKNHPHRFVNKKIYNRVIPKP